VSYNGEPLGQTPFKGNLPIGKGSLKVSKDGFFDKMVDIDMRMNSVYETTITLETSKVGELLNSAKASFRAGENTTALSTLVEALKYGGSAKEKAEVYYLLGQAYFVGEQWDQAKPYFEKARTHPDFQDRAALGLAQVYARQKDNEAAIKTVISVLANLTPTSPSEIRAEANAVFKKLSPILSVIYVYTEPAGADVFLNDRKLGQQTPLILSDLGLGSYRIEIDKPGYQTYKTKQTLKISEFVLVKVKLNKEQF
jgi:tetratricopeptide (TPR) repeat protein